MPFDINVSTPPVAPAPRGSVPKRGLRKGASTVNFTHGPVRANSKFHVVEWLSQQSLPSIPNSPPSNGRRKPWNMFDWLDLGRTPPEKFLTSAEIKAAFGGSQQTPRFEG